MPTYAKDTARWSEYTRRIDRLLDDLPAELETLARPLRVGLGLPSSAGEGLLSYCFLSSEPPVLKYTSWSLDDLGVPESGQRSALEEGLFLASFWLFAALEGSDVVLSPGCAMPREHLLLSQIFVNASDVCLAACAPRGSMAWEQARRALADRARAALAYRRGSRADAGELMDAAGLLWAPARAAVAAALESAGAGARVDGLIAVVDELSRAHQIHHELFSVSADCARGVITYPVARVAAALGIQLDRGDVAGEIVGALVASGEGARIAAEVRGRAVACAERAAQLGFARFASEARALAGRIGESAELLSAGALLFGAEGAAPGAEGTREAPRGGEPAVERALAMAEASLLADPDMHEAWEIHRWGLIGQPVLTGWRFPVGLIQENLAATGKDISAWAESALDRYVERRFEYFEEPSSLPPDIDSLGLMLRLVRHTRARARYAAALETPLGWLMDATGADGSVPVWLTAGTRGPLGYSALQGSDCTMCMVYVIRGLLSFDRARLSGYARGLLAQVIRRLDQRGGIGSAYYSSLYLAWQLAELAGELTADFAAERAAIAAHGRALFERHAGRVRVTPQDAALLLLARAALARSGASTARAPRWTDVLVSSQRSDGTWDSEPFYIMPMQGNGIGFHGSRLITTSLCYRALWSAGGRGVPAGDTP
ncbi:uncharacterized protein SOCE26_066280 [Sorangium cellulosum]|uniref:Uncharacterized protein n=1 Tax=Sorangium cellulosum TaxID=56 RepID=A0A2L0F0U2_SORCE|nr:hypothetical protein [Sorangium cellulosum]AUX45147.1 uncharacterized protein SOCE26_066280 [Sorangium cellulosum]